MEARLIGFDETPIDVVPDDYGFDSDICSDEVSDISSPSITPVNRWSSLAFKEVRRRPSETISDPSGDTDSQASGGSANGPARSHLFTFKVIVEIGRSSGYRFGVLRGT
ncbi:hypothetical protein Patl1_35320 [Pistacia atlantica]|nr:hypothetical protein Patl1_35320 [Pistacia atlantica]